MQPRLSFITSDLLTSNSATPQEKLGAVYTKPWIVGLMLDLAGYTRDADLVSTIAIEPSAGEGAFLVAMALRLIESAKLKGRSPRDCGDSLIAYELEEKTAAIARYAVIQALTANGVSISDAETLTARWIRIGDYLLEAATLPSAQFVIGNPPYIRLEDMSGQRADLYRSEYTAMKGRADIYVAFFQAALSQLTKDGVCAFICADRWMLNQYGEAGLSIGNNLNNRAEEVVGLASDVWVAFREGRFGDSRAPFLGYFFLLQDFSGVRRPVRCKEPYFL
jgi:adenine-specific DNA-methyltransferase